MQRYNKCTSKKFFCSRECLFLAGKKGIIKLGRPLSEIISDEGARCRARRMFPMEECEICGKYPSQRHHIDGNPQNNVRSNISFLCPKHHVHADRLETLRKIAYSGGRASVNGALRDNNGRFIKRTG